ncbi:MAG: hypothetical protein M1308_17285, partial [Actinobacteria bacterium]|nr:hypothetical protein [Actinomycetota bacterium]
MVRGRNKNSGSRILRNRFYPVIFLVVIVLVAVVLLMYVNNITRAKILEQREAKIVSQHNYHKKDYRIKPIPEYPAA